MNKRFMRNTLLLFLAAFFSPQMLWAANPTSISVDMAPSNPAPGEIVSIRLTSYSYDLDSVSISWSAGGQPAASGIGQKDFSVRAPAAGEELEVAATMTFPDGSVRKSILIRPAVMALLWQANDSYVPPFYKGKALPSAGSEIKLVAIPEIRVGGQTVGPKNLVYAWKKDYANESSASGFGKNFYLYTHDYLDGENTVSVTATTTDQKYSSAKSMTVSTFRPKIIFYPLDENLGTRWEKAVENNHRIEGEEILEAAPYFISPGDIRVPSFTWDWSINGTYVNVTGRKNILPVRVDAGASGTSRIKLEIGNKYKLFASTVREINVEF